MPLTKAWTGGQYSLVRGVACGSLAVALLWTGLRTPGFDTFSLVLAVFAGAVAIGLGPLHRTIAALLATLISFGVDCLGGAAVQYVALWLSAHILLPKAPYGSLAAAGRRDPRSGWHMPAWYPIGCVATFFAARIVASVHASMDHQDVLAWAFVFVATLVLFPKTALLGWTLSLTLGVALAAIGKGSASGAWFLHLLVFQPAWVPKKKEAGKDTVFYDGSCALCHGCVRFLLAEDTEPASFRIAPIGGETWIARVPQSERMRAPDSIVLLRGGRVMVRSLAVIEILDSLSGLWWIVATVARVVPRSMADRLYDTVASNRYRWFGRRSDACPLLPPDLVTRLEH
ncbi:MAG TPA: DCC1-like thiol-disulfide oxidoreductase family protein [Candidatus Binatia bacterium]